MVQRLKPVVAEYEDRLRKMRSVPRFSYGRGMLRKDGAPNRTFLTYLLVTRNWRFNFSRTWGSLGLRCSVTSAYEI